MTLEKFVATTTKTKLAAEMGIAKSTLYNYIKEPGTMPLSKALVFCENTPLDIETLFDIIKSTRVKDESISNLLKTKK